MKSVCQRNLICPSPNRVPARHLHLYQVPLLIVCPAANSNTSIYILPPALDVPM